MRARVDGLFEFWQLEQGVNSILDTITNPIQVQIYQQEVEGSVRNANRLTMYLVVVLHEPNKEDKEVKSG